MLKENLELAERALIATIARRFYIDGEPKSDIAKDLGFSRFQIARLLDKALPNGIIRIELDPLTGCVDHGLSERLRQRYGLRHALVARESDGGGAVDLDRLGQLAAALLAEVSGPGDVVGFSWNRAMEAMSLHLNPLPPGAVVVQLCGAWPGATDRLTSLDLVRNLAGLSQGRAHTFYAPMIATDAEAARAIKRQSDFLAAKAMFGKVTVALVGVGGWTAESSTLWHMLSPEECELTARQGVVAEMSGLTFDAGGNPFDSALSALAIGITAEELAACEEVIATTFDVERVPAVHAVLCGGRIITSLITHSSAAEALLALPAPGAD